MKSSGGILGTIALLLATAGSSAQGELSGRNPVPPMMYRGGLPSALADMDGLLPEEQGYFAGETSRIRWTRGLFGIVPERDGISAWAPPIEIGLAFFVGGCTVIKMIFIDLPSTVIVDRTR